MKVLGLVGWSGAGKTTLVAKLIPAFAARGLVVSTIKHAHHAFDIDTPGKDSFIHREAGAREVLVASANRWVLMHELRGSPAPSLRECLLRVSPVDLVLVEGFKTETHAKIEIHRVANGKPFLFPDDPGILAVASDAPPLLGPPFAPLDDVESIVALVLAHALALEETLRRLASAPR